MDERELVQRAKQGDLEAFNALVLGYQDAVYTLAYYLLGDERQAGLAAETAFRSAYGELREFRAGSLRGWLLRRAARACRASMRARGAVKPGREDGLQAGLASLPGELRLVVVLVDVMGMDYAEAGEVLGRPAAIVRERLARARQVLRGVFQQAGLMSVRPYS